MTNKKNVKFYDRILGMWAKSIYSRKTYILEPFLPAFSLNFHHKSKKLVSIQKNLISRTTFSKKSGSKSKKNSL